MTWNEGEITYPLGDGYELSLLRAEYNPTWGILYDPWTDLWLALLLATGDLLAADSARKLRHQLDHYAHSGGSRERHQHQDHEGRAGSET